MITTRAITAEDRIRQEQGARLAHARKQAGYRSARQAAIENTWPESTYRAHEGGSRTIGQDDAERYAKRFRSLGVKVDGRHILYGSEKRADSTPPVESSIVQVPLISWVSAGSMEDVSSLVEAGDVPLLPFTDLGRGSFFALRVSGDSMDRISPDQSIIIVNHADRTLVPGRFYVFSRRGQATYKRWHANPDYLAPYSTNPRYEPIFVANKRGFEVVGRVRRTVLDL